MASKQWEILYVEDKSSLYEVTLTPFENYFKRYDIASSRETALELFNKNSYDIVICDLSRTPEEIAFMKQLQDIKNTQSIFVLVDTNDEDKVYGFADMGIHAFIITPEQFIPALEAISEFDPYEEVAR